MKYQDRDEVTLVPSFSSPSPLFLIFEIKKWRCESGIRAKFSFCVEERSSNNNMSKPGSTPSRNTRSRARLETEGLRTDKDGGCRSSPRGVRTRSQSQTKKKQIEKAPLSPSQQIARVRTRSAARKGSAGNTPDLKAKVTTPIKSGGKPKRKRRNDEENVRVGEAVSPQFPIAARRRLVSGELADNNSSKATVLAISSPTKNSSASSIKLGGTGQLGEGALPKPVPLRMPVSVFSAVTTSITPNTSDEKCGKFMQCSPLPGFSTSSAFARFRTPIKTVPVCSDGEEDFWTR